MQSKISWANKELLLQIFRSIGWVSILYFIGLLILLPLRIMMDHSKYRKDPSFEPEKLEGLFVPEFELQFGLLITIPVLMAIFLFRYLHVRQASDMMHGLPITRQKLFHHYALSGIFFLAVPVIATGLSIYLVKMILNLNYLFSTADIFYWMGATILFSVVIYAAGLFVCMMTGISAVQGVLTYIFLLFPPGIVLLVYYNLEKLFYGFPVDYFRGINLEHFSPVTFAIMLYDRPLTWGNVLILGIVAALFYGFALFFYKKRKSESASEAIAFHSLRAVFKYGTTFCFMLLGGAYFSAVQGGSYGWLLFGYAAGTVLGFFVAETVLQKTWRVFTRLKGLFIYSGIIALVITVVHFLGFYENKVPNPNEVKNVILSDIPYVHSQNYNYEHSFAPLPVSSPENIKAITNLHKQIVSDKEINQGNHDVYDQAFFLYELKNGRKVIRQYTIDKEVYEDFYKPLYENEEFVRATTEIFHFNPEKLNHIQISANGGFSKSVTLKKRAEMKEFMAALEEDVLAESVEDARYFSDMGSYIEIRYNNDYYTTLTLKPNYSNARAWLKSKDLLEQVNVMPGDIKEIKVGQWEGGYYEEAESQELFENEIDILTVTDEESISMLFSQASNLSRKGYILKVIYKYMDYEEIYFMDDAHAPQFIKQQLP